MARRILSVEMGTRRLSAVALRRAWRRPALEGVLCLDLPDAGAPPEEWAQAADAFRGWRDALGRPGFTVASLPATEAFSARLRLPFRRVAQVARVIKAEMEDEMPFTLEETVVDFVPAAPPGPEGLEVFAVAAPKVGLAAHLERLGRLGIRADRLHYAPLAALRATLELVPATRRGTVGVARLERDHATFLLAREGRPALARVVRSQPGGDAAEGEDFLLRELALTLRGWASALEGGAPDRLVLAAGEEADDLARRVETELETPCVPLAWGGSLIARSEPPPNVVGATAAALGGAVETSGRGGFTLLREEFARREGWAELRAPVAAAAAALLLAGAAGAANLSFQVRREERRLQAVEERLHTAVAGIFPGERRPLDVQRLLAERVEAAAKRLAVLTGGAAEKGGPLDLLARISAAVPPRVQVRLNRLDLDEQGVMLDGETADFDSVEQIKLGLVRKAGFENLEVRQARLLTGRRGVHFLMRVRFAKTEGSR